MEQLPEREPLNFDEINSTILQLKEYPYQIKQWMILTALGIMTLTLIVALVIIIWKVNHMRGALGQMGEIFTKIKNKSILSGLLEAGKAAQKLPTTVSAGPSDKEVPIESSIKIKGVRKSTDDSEGVTTDTP